MGVNREIETIRGIVSAINGRSPGIALHLTIQPHPKPGQPLTVGWCPNTPSTALNRSQAHSTEFLVGTAGKTPARRDAPSRRLRRAIACRSMQMLARHLRLDSGLGGALQIRLGKCLASNQCSAAESLYHDLRTRKIVPIVAKWIDRQKVSNYSAEGSPPQYDGGGLLRHLKF
jgi:hypothetical protein